MSNSNKIVLGLLLLSVFSYTLVNSKSKSFVLGDQKTQTIPCLSISQLVAKYCQNQQNNLCTDLQKIITASCQK